MLAKITAKNQLTLPKSATKAVGATEYLDVQVRDGQIILTPVRIQRGDAVRAKLAELGLGEADVLDAVRWARASAPAPAPVAAEPAQPYATPVRARAAAKKKPAPRKPARKA